jgi:energy-coupling factor transport system ATP-binding protein
VLRVRDVSIVHDGADVATPADVSFEVAPGEVVLLLGPSGSGKSTLALSFNGLVPQDVPARMSGTVEAGGQDAATTPVPRMATRVGMVFQDPDAQLVTGTVFDEVAFGPENLRVPVADVLARTETALRRTGLWDRRDDNPDRLSGGGRQRLAIAAALALDAPVLVLDEPTANLDPRGIEDVYAALGDLVAAGDRAIVLIEHNLDAAIDLVDRVVVLDVEGRVFADGPVDDVLRGRAEELLALGVWLPTSALAALQLRRAGYALDPLPLTPAALRAALTRAPARERTDRRAEAPRPDDSSVLAQVRGLTLRRGRETVLRDVDLDVARGDLVAVVGPNGAGKTSLVQAIAGVLRPPRGTVRIEGRDVARTDARTLSRHVGFVFQNPEHQFIAATVFDELAHGLRRQRVPEPEVRERVERMLTRFGLERHAGAHPFLLSGGQKRRLSVGTALIAGARLLVLDEPTFGQDRARAEALLDLLGDLSRSGTTIIVVTHDLQLVADHAARTVVVAGGRVVASAPTADVLADDELLERAGLRPPPLRRALSGLSQHPQLARITRVADLLGGDA